MSKQLKEVKSEPQRITQHVMREYLKLQANAKLIEARLEEEKERLVKLLKDASTTAEAGPLQIVLTETPVHRPKWKDEFERLAGKEAVAIVQAATPATFSQKITVSMRPTLEV